MSTVLSSPPDALATPEQDRTLTAPSTEPTRLVDALFGSVLLFGWVPAVAPSFLSLGLAATGGLVLVATTRHPVRRLSGVPSRLGWLTPYVLATFAFVLLVTVLTPDDSIFGWQKRALRLVLVFAYLAFLVTGRIHYPSVVRGMAAGLVVNAGLFFAGLAPDNYGQYLSGFLLDKNQAGLSYTVVGLLFAGLQPGNRRRNLVLAATAALVWTTGSRASLAALACGIAWIVLAHRFGRWGRLVLAVGVALFVRTLESSYARVGVFADRDGTDFLRSRIDAASVLKLDVTPPWGSGLGDAYVDLQGKTFLFHNSYWAAMQEGGWVLAGFYVLLTAGLGVSLLRTRSAVTGWAGAEAANVAVLICAFSLGEVFGAATATTALGAGLLGVMARRRALAAADEPPVEPPVDPPVTPGVAAAVPPVAPRPDRPGRGG